MIKFIMIALLVSVLGITACNESREIPLPVEQVRPSFVGVVQPADSVLGISRNLIIRMRFSEPMNPASFPGNFHLWEDEQHSSEASGEFTAEGSDVLFQPDQPLMKAHEYFTELRARVKDINGNGIDKDTLTVAQTEFITEGDYAQNGVPEVLVSNGSEDFLARLFVQDGKFKSDTVGDISGFGRQLEMAFTPDGKYLLMSDYNSSNSGVYIFDADNGYQLVKKLDTNSDGSEVKKSAEIVVTADQAYVVNQSSKKISVIKLSDLSMSAVISLPGTPKGMAVLPDGSALFVGSALNNQVWQIDTQTGQLVKTIAAEGISKCVRLAASANGAYVVVREFNGSKLAFIDVTAQSVKQVIDLGYKAPAGNNNDLAAFGDYIFITSNSGKLTKIDVNTQTVVAEISDMNFQGLDIYPSGEFIFAAARSGDSQVVVLKTDDLKIVRRITIHGTAPWDALIRPANP